MNQPSSDVYQIHKRSDCSKDLPKKNARAVISDDIIIEEPLEIAISHFHEGHLQTDPLMVTMRTPGDDEALVKGILFSEGIIRNSTDILKIDYSGKNKGKYGIENSVVVTLKDGNGLNMNQLYRNFVVNSACGVCGKGTINALEIAHEPDIIQDYPMVNDGIICKLPIQVQKLQSLFAKTGGVHASALVNRFGDVVHVAEDVGRHNALDKLIGSTKAIIDPKEHLIFCSGRLSFELVQKTLMAGIGFIVSIGAPSSLAIDLAKRFNVTLIGFIKDDSYNVYCGEWRLEGNEYV